MNSKFLQRCFWKSFPRHEFKISPYKDPVENHPMKKIIDKVITGFFVVILGALWYFSTKYYVHPNHYNIIIYDTLGKEFKIDEIRTNFKTKNVAISYAKEYKNRFPSYDFAIAEEFPQIKGRRIFARIQR